jgi:hypothetical protein
VDVEGKGLLQAHIEGASFDAETGEANNCCGDYLIEDPTDTVGTPINTRARSSSSRSAPNGRTTSSGTSTSGSRDRRFDGTEKIKGLQTYRFVQNIPDTVIGQEDVPGR